MSSGIYWIANKINNKLYIGSAANLKKRWGTHKHSLKQNKHKNIHLQNAWNTYGPRAFAFEIKLYCDKNNLLFYEQLFLNRYFDSCVNCYNINPVAGSNLGKPLSTETRQKISNALVGKPISLERRENMSRAKIGIKRKAFSDEHKRNISVAKQGSVPSVENRKKSSEANSGSGNPAYRHDLDNDKILIDYKNGMSLRTIAKKYNTDKDVIKRRLLMVNNEIA